MRRPLGFSVSSAPDRSGTGHARHGGDRSNTTRSYVSGISQTSSTSSLTTCDLVSQWSQFLRSQAEAILACDFFSVDLPGGTQASVLAVIEHATRRIRILGVTLYPTGEWTAQQARNLIMDLGEQAHRVKFMIRDRGSNFTAASGAVLADAGIRTVLCNVRTPGMNAITERWIGGCRRELLDRTLVWNQHHLRRILREYETHHMTISTGRTAPCTAPRRSNRCPKRSILSSTASEGRLASVA